MSNIVLPPIHLPLRVEGAPICKLLLFDLVELQTRSDLFVVCHHYHIMTKKAFNSSTRCPPFSSHLHILGCLLFLLCHLLSLAASLFFPRFHCRCHHRLLQMINDLTIITININSSRLTINIVVNFVVGVNCEIHLHKSSRVCCSYSSLYFPIHGFLTCLIQANFEG